MVKQVIILKQPPILTQPVDDDILKDLLNKTSKWTGSKLIVKPIRKERFCSNLKEESVSCPICLEVMARPVVTQCGHAFCLGCIDECFLQAAAAAQPLRCCVCRQELKFYDYHESKPLRTVVALYI
jgi:hypothetical protein